MLVKVIGYLHQIIKYSKFLKNVKRINIALDKDATEKALEMAEYFCGNGIDVYFIELPEKDPSELGFKNINKIINQVEKLTPQKLLEYKINAY